MDKGLIALLCVIILLAIATLQPGSPTDKCTTLTKELQVLQATIILAEGYGNAELVEELEEEALKLIFNTNPTKECINYMEKMKELTDG